MDRANFILYCIESTLQFWQFTANSTSLDCNNTTSVDVEALELALMSAILPALITLFQLVNYQTQLKGIPSWAAYFDNQLGVLPWMPDHFTAYAAFQDKLIKAVVGTGRACSLVDIATNKRLGVPFDLPIATCSYGWYWELRA